VTDLNDPFEPIPAEVLSWIEDVREEWDAYKKSDHPIFLVRLMGKLERASDAFAMPVGMLCLIAGGELERLLAGGTLSDENGLRAFAGENGLRDFCMREATRHATENFNSDHPKFISAGYVFEKLGLTLTYDMKKEQAQKEVSYAPGNAEKGLSLLKVFSGVVQRPVVYHASNWTGHKFEGFKQPSVILK